MIDAELGVLVNRWRAHDERLPSVGVSEDGALVATATADHVVNLWDTDAQLLRARFPRHAQRVTSLHFSEAARILLSLDHDGRLQPWDLDRLHQGADQLLSEAERRFGCRVDDSRIDPVVEVRGPLRVRAP